MPLVSVIVPVYNGENTIRETLESVFIQTVQDFEIIVINDGSQDATLEILSSIQDLRLKVFSYPNAGQAASRNRGFANSSGEFIAFLDADDLWTPNKLEAQLKALQDNPHVAVAYSWSDFVDENGKFLRGGSRSTLSGDVYAKLVLTDFLDNGSNPLIRRQALLEVGGFDESLSPAEDWDMWLRLAARYHFVVVPLPQILYRQSSKSESTNLLRMASACERTLARTFEQAPQSLNHLKRHSLANVYKYLIFRCFNGNVKRSRALVAAKFLGCAIWHEPSLIQKRITWKVLLQIAIVVFLQPQLAQALLPKMKRIANLDTLLLHMRLEPF
jgi:glycosyltransferase involved in cell wall biosynthesis